MALLTTFSGASNKILIVI